MRVQRAIDRASAPAMLKRLISALIGLAAVSGCANQNVRSVDRFWLHAAPKVRLVLRPAMGAVTPGSTERFVIRGAVRRQVGVAGGGYRLDLDQPKSSITYHLGANRQLPLITGARVRIVVFVRQHAVDPAVDVGMLAYARQAGGGKQIPTERLVAVVQDNGVVPSTLVPQALNAIRPTDVIAYHHGRRRDAQCDEIYEHRYFRLSRPSLLSGSDAKTPDGRLFAPGSRLRLYHTQKSTYDLLLVDNRSVNRTNCRRQPVARWSWSAVWLSN